MAKQTINIGSAPNDGNGDTGRAGASKINDNFTELYDYVEGSTALPGSLEVTTDLTVGGVLTVDNFRLSDTSWDDIKFPFIGRNIDTSAGRIDYNYSELGVDFANNARYADTEQISMVVQMNHDYKIGTNIAPHVHWIQSADVSPNWLMEYRIYDNGETIPAVWTQATTTKVFTYTSGTILQISSFPDIDMSSISGVSSFIDVKFYRDVFNASGEFAGAESGPVTETVKELDIHYQRDSFGSDTEFVKDSP